MAYHAPGMGPEETASWSAHFGGVAGVVDVLDPINSQVRVRGRDKQGNLYTVWIDPDHLNVTEKGVR